MKKVTVKVLLIICMPFILFPRMASASETPMSGACGKEGGNLTWSMEPEDGSYTLIIKGTGEMEDYEHAPWPQLNEIKKVIVEEGVTSIGSFAFYHSHIRSIQLPNTLKSIGSSAFDDCCELAEVKIPDSVVTIGRSAFSNCGELGSIVIPSGVTAIEQYTFNSCKRLTKVTIPNSVTKIGSWAFGSCAFSSIVIPDGVTCIEGRAFRYSHLKNVFLPKSVIEIGDDAFLGVTDILGYRNRGTTMGERRKTSGNKSI